MSWCSRIVHLGRVSYWVFISCHFPMPPLKAQNTFNPAFQKKRTEWQTCFNRDPVIGRQDPVEESRWSWSRWLFWSSLFHNEQGIQVISPSQKSKKESRHITLQSKSWFLMWAQLLWKKEAMDGFTGQRHCSHWLQFIVIVFVDVSDIVVLHDLWLFSLIVTWVITVSE